jgi:hypothetical protein
MGKGQTARSMALRVIAFENTTSIIRATDMLDLHCRVNGIVSIDYIGEFRQCYLMNFPLFNLIPLIEKTTSDE